MLRSIEINIIVYNPFDKSAINAGTRGCGIIKSTDGGESWKATELVRDNISAIAIDSVYPNIIYASDEWRIFKGEMLVKVGLKSTMALKDMTSVGFCSCR